MAANARAGLWCADDTGYLIHVDMPAEATCRMCGARYTRSISDRKPWQQPVPDKCPSCGHEGALVPGIAFETALAEN